ncbi:carbon-nitrogen hydrolase family protein [Billgrantia saliphila]|uniref:carbon-nitrogen hydrolase family protein n=1 Tax=Billgrantia saliphila TaxID=1848458 RepID=UPI000CE44D2D|nr:carbon-nitrogen hydrolase family protein [Halomonas saliphila]
MKLCAVQCASITGDIERNVARHAECVALAVSHGAGLAVFPELSLTGYAPSLAKRLATHPDDARLDALQQLSDAHGIAIAAGLPLVTPDKPRIGMVLFQPHAARQAYAKQMLHTDELPYFSAGERSLVFEADGRRIVPAICYESLQPEHASAAAGLGAQIYLASVAKQAGGMEAAHAHYAAIAREHVMTVLLANCLGPCDGDAGAGRSAAWNHQGELVASLDDTREALLLYDTERHTVAILPGDAEEARGNAR